MMAERRSPVHFPHCPVSQDSTPLFTERPAGRPAGRGRPVIAPATFNVTSSQRDGPNSGNDPWRRVDWSEGHNRDLMEFFRFYKPAHESVPAARVLLVGPVGAGKSSFISSLQSVFYGRVVQRAMVGTALSPTASFTKQMQSFQLYASREEDEHVRVVLSDMIGIGETDGLRLHDTLAVVKGHIPDGHTFKACCPVVADDPGYVREPSLADRVHCVVFVLSEEDLSSYSETMKSTFHQLREHISSLGVQQMALLTHVDSAPDCDISQVYNGTHLRSAMLKVGALLGMPLTSIIPVKNYSEELELDAHTDTLLLNALEHILLYADLYLRDHPDTDRADGGESQVSEGS